MNRRRYFVAWLLDYLYLLGLIVAALVVLALLVLIVLDARDGHLSDPLAYGLIGFASALLGFALVSRS